MNAEEPNDDYDAQAAEAARKANIEELNAVMPQLQMNAKDEGQQWERNYSIGGLVFYRNGEPPVKALYGEREILAHLNALQQQLADMKAKAALADELRDRLNHADHRDAQQLREQLEEAQDELKFVNLRKEEKLRDNLMHALGHTKDDGHTYEQHELGQLLEDVFYHYRDELPVLREQRDHSAVRAGVWAARAGLYASQRDKALERVRVLEEWIVEHEMHEEGCPQADEYKGEWDTAPDGALRKWLDEHQNCTCGMWELLGRVSLDDDVNRALLFPAAATEGGEGA